MPKVEIKFKNGSLITSSFEIVTNALDYITVTDSAGDVTYDKDYIVSIKFLED